MVKYLTVPRKQIAVFAILCVLVHVFELSVLLIANQHLTVPRERISEVARIFH